MHTTSGLGSGMSNSSLPLKNCFQLSKQSRLPISSGCYPTVVILIFLFFNAGCESFLLFYPQREFVENALLKEFSYEDIYFKTPDGLKLHGWYIKAKNEKKGTILYLHGNAENISTQINNVLWLSLEGYALFAFDYRGFGKSEGSPTMEGVHLDAKAAIDTVLNLSSTKKERIFVLGQSLGGAIAVYSIATSPYKSRIKALTIDSTLAGYRIISRDKLAQSILTWPLQPLSLLMNDHYSPILWIAEVSPVPLLIIHGEKDRTIPVRNGAILYENAIDPKEYWLVKDVGHIQAFDLQAIREKYLIFLRSTD